MDALDLQKEEVFNLLKKFISEVIGEEFAEELDITLESTFTKDLEMDSIEIVALAEKVRDHYKNDFDFNEWIASMDMEQLIDLRIIDIINFITDANNKNK